VDIATQRANKIAVMEFIQAMDATGVNGTEQVLHRYCAQEVIWEIFHPFNTLRGSGQAAGEFWDPLYRAFPDAERRLDIFVGDMFKDEYWVTCLGHLCGTFDHAWLDIPPTGELAYIRVGEFYLVRDGRIARAHVLLDIPDVMRQAGVYPFRPMPGVAGFAPGPRMHDGIRLGDDDPKQRALETVLGMHEALHDFDGVDVDSMDHARFWSDHFLYHAPCGIGSSRGMEGFRQCHQRPFLASFPDRQGREHYVRISDGPIACTSHWGTLTATHLGSDWLGLPATGKTIRMRVADWYCCDSDWRLHENWLMMDILDICMQMGFDVLTEFRQRRTPQ